jgi:cephalosporin hydroxylase
VFAGEGMNHMDNTQQAWRKRNYADVYRGHGAYSSFKWNHYPFVYDEILAPYLDAGKPVTLLEIGVQNGGSLQIWKDYLPPGSIVHGMDINERCRSLEFGEGIHFHLMDATQLGAVNQIFADTRLDIIIDDGSHVCSDVITTFINLFKKLTLGGVYIVEDMHTSYAPSYGGGLRNTASSVEFFKNFADTVNFDFIDKSQRIPDDLHFMSIYRQQVSSIAFYDSVCAIRKFAQPKTRRFAQIWTGTDCRVTSPPPTPQQLEDSLGFIDHAHSLFVRGPDIAEAPLSISAGREALERGHTEQAFAIFSELYARTPGDPILLVYHALICMRLGALQDAVLYLKDVLRMMPVKNKASSVPDAEMAVVADAIDVLRKGRLEEAFFLFAESRRQHPENYIPLVYQSIICLRLGTVPDTLALLMEAASLAGDAARMEKILDEIFGGSR